MTAIRTLPYFLMRTTQVSLLLAVALECYWAVGCVGPRLGEGFTVEGLPLPKHQPRLLTVGQPGLALLLDGVDHRWGKQRAIDRVDLRRHLRGVHLLNQFRRQLGLGLVLPPVPLIGEQLNQPAQPGLAV